jgi:hypothetical protein
MSNPTLQLLLDAEEAVQRGDYEGAAQILIVRSRLQTVKACQLDDIEGAILLLAKWRDQVKKTPEVSKARLRRVLDGNGSVG